MDLKKKTVVFGFLGEREREIWGAHCKFKMEFEIVP